MKVGDLVKFKDFCRTTEKVYLVTEVFGSGVVVSLYSFPKNQVFQSDKLEVVSESR